MKNLIIGIWLIITLLNCTAITNRRSAEQFKKDMDSWLGYDINTAIMELGPPSKEYIMPNKNKQYSWLKVGSTQVTANYNYYINRTIANKRTYWCETTLTVNLSGKIISWHVKGNSCR